LFFLRRQPQNFENVTLVARRRVHFRGFLVIFLVAQLPLKRGVLVHKNSLANRVYRLYSEGWQTGKELLNGLQTVDKRRNNHRPSEQYAQPLLESKIYVARRTHIEAPARSTVLRRVGLLEALSSAAPSNSFDLVCSSRSSLEFDRSSRSRS